MKKNIYWLLIVSGMLIAIVLLFGGSAALADPETGSEEKFALMPFVSSPALPPTVKLVPFATEFSSDTLTAIVNAGDERLFVVERSGTIVIVHPDGTKQQKPFLDIREMVETDNWEEGLLGLVFHPNYPSVPHFWVSYTPDDTHLKISRFSVKAGDPSSAQKSSEAVLMHIDKEGKKGGDNYHVHNAGDMHFGLDGYLYIAIGDGGPDPNGLGLWGDPDNRGQKADELMANILRIDVNEAGGGLPPDCGSDLYTIPGNNPFVDGPGGSCDEIWSIGLRNPYRFSFDRVTGDMFIGEVGEARREEIHYQPAGSSGGENYGWACYEGTVAYQVIEKPYLCPPEISFTPPLVEYDQPNGCASVIGGYVYRGKDYPELYGRYIFGDFCSRKMWLLSRSSPTSWSQSDAGKVDPNISTFGEDVNGELYVGEWNKGATPTVYRVTVEP